MTRWQKGRQHHRSEERPKIKIGIWERRKYEEKKRETVKDKWRKGPTKEVSMKWMESVIIEYSTDADFGV